MGVVSKGVPYKSLTSVCTNSLEATSVGLGNLRTGPWIEGLAPGGPWPVARSVRRTPNQVTIRVILLRATHGAHVISSGLSTPNHAAIRISLLELPMDLEEASSKGRM